VVGSTRQELRKFLLEPPTTRAKVKQSDFTLWNAHVSEATLRQYFEPVAEGSVCQNLSIDISHLLIKPAVIIGENEDGCHARIDQCVTAFIHQFAPEFIFLRNALKDSSSYPLKRPDFSATVRGHGCFFRGEEKMMGSGEDPKSELRSKLQKVWPFPGLPYLLRYYSEGTVLTFCRVSSDAAEDVTKPLMLDSASARLECWNIVRNIARIIRFMMRFDSISPFDLQDLRKGRAEGHDWIRTIAFSGGHVLKDIQLRDDEMQGKLNRVLAVLAIIKPGIKGVQPIVSYNLSSSVNDPSKRRRVEPRLYVLTTFGQSIPKVRDGAHLQELVRFLLNTIRNLHNSGITHRDIRLPNIVRNSNGSYGLIDWDESVHGLEDLPNENVIHLAQECHAPEMFLPGLTHTHTVDLWSVGYLIDKNLAHADDRLVSLKNELLKGPDQRLEVNAAIAHLDAP
jgi:Protein kinase domain